MNQFLNKVLIFLWFVVREILQRIAQGLWDEMWKEIIRAVQEAEKKWEESGRGAQKREWVINEILTFIDSKTKLNWLQKQLVRLFVGEVVDAIIGYVNDTFGHDWAKKVEELEKELAAKIPFIE